jgi:hypothetical protein
MLATEKLINDLNINQKRVDQLLTKFNHFVTIVRAFTEDRQIIKGLEIKVVDTLLEVLFCQKKMFLVFGTTIPQGQSYLKGAIEIYLNEDFLKQSSTPVKKILFNQDGETELQMSSINDPINISDDTHAINLFLNLLNDLLIA